MVLNFWHALEHPRSFFLIIDFFCYFMASQHFILTSLMLLPPSDCFDHPINSIFSRFIHLRVPSIALQTASPAAMMILWLNTFIIPLEQPFAHFFPDSHSVAVRYFSLQPYFSQKFQYVCLHTGESLCGPDRVLTLLYPRNKGGPSFVKLSW